MKPDTTALLLALVAYAVGAVWWAATVQVKIDGLQAYISQTAQHINNLDYNAPATLTAATDRNHCTFDSDANTVTCISPIAR